MEFFSAEFLSRRQATLKILEGIVNSIHKAQNRFRRGTLFFSISGQCLSIRFKVVMEPNMAFFPLSLTLSYAFCILSSLCHFLYSLGFNDDLFSLCPQLVCHAGSIKLCQFVNSYKRTFLSKPTLSF